MMENEINHMTTSDINLKEPEEIVLDLSTSKMRKKGSLSLEIMMNLN